MPARPPRIFVADDQRDVTESLRLLLKGEGYTAETFDHPEALLGALRTRAPDAVLMDLNYTRDTTSGDEGLDTIARIRAFDAYTPIVVMTAWGTSALAVEAMRRGAQDFIEKPWDNERLLSVLQDAGRARPGAEPHARARGREPPDERRGHGAHRRVLRRCGPCSRRSSAWRRPTRTC